MSPSHKTRAPRTRPHIDAQSIGAVVLEGLVLAAGIFLLFFGHSIVRSVNFFAGAYLAAIFALVAMHLLMPGASCALVMALPLAAALVFGLLCASLRKSMYVALGLIAGDLVGSYLYEIALGSTDLGARPRFFTMGFFSFGGAIAAWYVGEWAWVVSTALIGAYLSVTSFIQLVLIPALPNGELFARFVNYRSALASLATDWEDDLTALSTSPYMWGPCAAVGLLGLAGICVQQRGVNKAYARAAEYGDGDRLLPTTFARSHVAK